MKKLFLLIGCTLSVISPFAQRITQLTLPNNSSRYVITILVDETVMVNISKDGKIINWGVENNTSRTYNYPGRLDKYMGKEEYYPPTANDTSGKVKYIGRTAFAYYSPAENEALRGKLKSIGSVNFEYYAPYEDEAFRGNIKNAGAVSFTYFGSFDNAAYKGKLKAVGPTALTYYSSFDDNAYRGKIKSIDRQSFVYYSSFDRKEYAGVMKTGYPALYINSIKYFISN